MLELSNDADKVLMLILIPFDWPEPLEYSGPVYFIIADTFNILISVKIKPWKDEQAPNNSARSFRGVLQVKILTL